MKMRKDAHRTECVHQLRVIEQAKQLWASENGKDASVIPAANDLDKYAKSGLAEIKCPKGGSYSINAVGKKPNCSFAGHELPKSIPR